MRTFSPEYLQTTREGMWEDSREALSDLGLGRRECVLDVGAGTGELTRVLREESPGTVVALDTDLALLGSVPGPRIAGDATRLPLPDDAVDLVVCQALLVNLPDPKRALREFARVASGRVAAIEPDNGAVTIDSTVDEEPSLARRIRERYLQAARTDPTLGSVPDPFEEIGLEDVTVRRYDHERTIEPPYSQQAVESAKRKATGEGIEGNRETVLDGTTSPEEFDDLRQEWRAMGRSVVEQMQAAQYRHRETVPFYVTVGHV